MIELKDLKLEKFGKKFDFNGPVPVEMEDQMKRLWHRHDFDVYIQPNGGKCVYLWTHKR